jgi:hypothetical protein
MSDLTEEDLQDRAHEALSREFNPNHEKEHVARFEKRTGQYVAVRDKIREIEEQHTEELKPFVELQNALTAWFTEQLDNVGAKSVKTAQGTVYQSTRYSASLNDPKAFMDYVITTQSWDLLDRKANSTAVRDFIEQHKSEPPGVRLSAIRTVGVRRASDK